MIDDCCLAAAIKRGGPVWLGLADDSRSLRGYDGLRGIWDMVARTAYVQLDNSVLLLAGTLLGMTAFYLALAAFVATSGFIGLQIHGLCNRFLRAHWRLAGLPIEMMETSFFLSRELFAGAGGGAGMARWRDRVFATMARNAGSVTDYFNIPNTRVIELGTRIEI